MVDVDAQRRTRQRPVALVLGASRGLGFLIARELGARGHDLAVVARSADGLEAARADLEATGAEVLTLPADLSSRPGAESVVEAADRHFGRLDVVVANAGIHTAGGPAWTISPEDWQRTIDVNLTGVWHTVKAAVPHIGSDGGSVVIISSTNGLRGTGGTAHYTASKHAAVGLARTLANELGPQRIRVNTVHPGAVATPMVRNETTYRRLRPDLENPTEADAAEVLTSRNLLPVPWVQPVDVANAAVFLASDEARYITGCQLVVDAGLTQKTT
jgi:NAD(P)-dependent dehydrogenase (short-subunit alcohol dehydrogenase family)